MTNQEAIRVLMLSPIYFKLTPLDRKQLIHEYCALFAEACRRSQNRNNEKNRLQSTDSKEFFS